MRRAPIRLLTQLGTGHTPSRSHPEYWAEEERTIPWLTLADVWQLRDGTTTVIRETTERITPKGVANSSAVVHPAGTVALSRTASVGFSCILGHDMATSQDFVTWTCGPHLDPRFLLWVLRGERDDIVGRMRGSTHKTIYMSDIEQLTTPVPDIGEQRRIAAFLDAETERINQLITTKTRMIEVLSERRWATVSEVVPLSGSTVPLRRCLLSITDGPFGSSLTSNHYESAGCRVVRLGNIGLAEFLKEDEAYIDHTHAATLAKHRVTEGNLLIGGLGDQNNHVGRACVAPDLGEAIVKADCYAATVDPSVAHAPFLAMVLSSPYGRDAVAVASRGTTRNRINLDVAKAIPVPLPSVAEQVEAVAEFHRRGRIATSLAADLQVQIDLLHERRRSLITAAVTGEMAVP